jgi:predicted amidophosphoribosyltransferase
MMTRPPQRLTTVVCTGCGITTRNWSRLCNACTKRLAADGSASMPGPQPRCAREDQQAPLRHPANNNNLVDSAPDLREVIHSIEVIK